MLQQRSYFFQESFYNASSNAGGSELLLMMLIICDISLNHCILLRLPTESTYSHPPKCSALCSNTNSFSGSRESYFYVTNMWSQKIKPKSYFIFQEVQKQPKMPAAMLVATTDYWGNLCGGLTVCYLILRCRVSACKNIRAMLMWHFVMLEIPHFVIEFVSNLCCFNSVLLSDKLSVKRVGGFLTALSLGFILLMKFEFLLSFIFLCKVFCCSKRIRSVGRHVGITFWAKDIASIRCLETSLASVSKMNIYLFWDPYFNSVEPKLIMITQHTWEMQA